MKSKKLRAWVWNAVLVRPEALEELASDIGQPSLWLTAWLRGEPWAEESADARTLGRLVMSMKGRPFKQRTRTRTRPKRRPVQIDVADFFTDFAPSNDIGPDPC